MGGERLAAKLYSEAGLEGLFKKRANSHRSREIWGVEVWTLRVLQELLCILKIVILTTEETQPPSHFGRRGAPTFLLISSPNIACCAMSS